MPAGKLFNFFIYSNLFIAICAVLMVDHTCRLLLHRGADIYLLAFVFFSTVCSYSFHWYLTSSSEIPSRRIDWLSRNKTIHLVFLVAGLVGSFICFFYLHHYWPWLAIAAIMTFLYSAPKIPQKHFRLLRKIALGKTIFLAVVWTYVTVIISLVIPAIEWTPDFYFYVISRFFLIYAICILFDYRDRHDDKAKGIRSLITYMNEKSIRHLFFFSLLLFFAFTLLMLSYGHDIITILLLSIPGIICALIFDRARKSYSDMLYYFVLDGLMVLSPVLMLLAEI